MYKIGKRIKFFREKAGLSQKELAQKIKQQNATVSNWERGLTRPNVDVLADICSALNVPPDELLDICLLPDIMNDSDPASTAEILKKVQRMSNEEVKATLAYIMTLESLRDTEPDPIIE